MKLRDRGAISTTPQKQRSVGKPHWHTSRNVASRVLWTLLVFSFVAVVSVVAAYFDRNAGYTSGVEEIFYTFGALCMTIGALVLLVSVTHFLHRRRRLALEHRVQEREKDFFSRVDEEVARLLKVERGR